MRHRKIDESYFKSAIFGFEDGLVSTTGVVAGLGAGGHNPHLIILGGLVNIGAQAVSMGAGEYLSERGVHAMRGNHHKDVAGHSGIVMSVSFIVAGFIPLAPIMLVPYPHSIIVSLAAALVGLFVLGVAKAKVVFVKSYLRSAIETLIIGGLAALIGFIVGISLRV